MIRVVVLLTVLTSCSFDTGGPLFEGPDGGLPDGGGGTDSTFDAPAGDAAPDAPPPVPVCDDLPSTVLSLGQVTSGTTVGAANLVASADADCGGASSPEQIHVVSITARADLHVSTDLAGTTFDTVVYVRRVCGDPSTELACNAGPKPGSGEDTWALDLAPGNYAVVVDGYSGAEGPYGVIATTRPVLGLGDTCDPAGITDRCEPGTLCYDPGSGPVCADSSAICEMDASPIPLTRTPTMGNTNQGTDFFEASCNGGPAGAFEAMHQVDVSMASARDLVVEVTPQGGTLDPVLEVTSQCGDTATSLACVDAAAAGTGEAVAIPSPASGTYFLAVDGAESTSGPYRIRAWLRLQRALGAGCDRMVLDDRCVEGACVQTGAAPSPLCTLLTPISDGENNYDMCAAPGTAGAPEGPFSGDFHFAGRMNSASDSDVFRLTPSVDTRLVATAVGTEGGCPVRLVIELRGPGGCTLLNMEPDLITTATGGTVGACPHLDTDVAGVQLEGGETYWLVIPPAVPAREENYSLVVDFVPL